MTDHSNSEKSEVETSSSSVSLKSVLGQLTHLSEDELVKVRRLVDALLPTDQASGSEMVERTGDELAEVQDWLKSIINRKPVEQLALIDESLENVEGADAIALLNRERQALLNREPSLAMKVAILRQARERPLFLLIGILGLIFGVGSFVWGLFHRVF